MKIEITTEERNALFHACNARIHQLNEIDPKFGRATLHESIVAERDALETILCKLQTVK